MSDEGRRRQEISLFDAMALGVDIQDEDRNHNVEQGNTSHGTMDHPEQVHGDTAGIPQELSAQSSVTDQVRENFDTFQFSAGSQQTKNADVERSNLEAAAAALSVDDNSIEESAPGTQIDVQQSLPTTSLNHEHTTPTVTHSAAASRQQLADENAPMFIEEIVMPRPLFFGAIVPQRVLREGRMMVKQAMEELGLQRHDSVSLQELPESTRNLIGALRTFGFSLDDLLCYDYNEFSVRGDTTVSTFQPVWGESDRVDRIREHRNQMLERANPISRSSTAPPRLMAAFASGTEGSWETGLSCSTTNSSKTHSNLVTTSSNRRKSHLDEEKSLETSLTSINTMFSKWLKEDDNDDEGCQFTEQGDDEASKESINTALTPVSDETSDMQQPQVLSEQELFSQWARGSESIRSEKNRQGTFQRIPLLHITTSDDGESDDDSVNYDELKKQVGISDHLNKAIASLADDDSNEPTDSVAVEETKIILSQTPADLRTRPLTNYELTNGCVPLFGYDDSPLPVDSDLGKYETKEEALRTYERKRSQDIIEKLVAPDVFGCISCPNPALNPDDFHSWNSRSSSAHRVLLSDTGSYLAQSHSSISTKKLNDTLDSTSTASLMQGVTLPKPRSKGKRIVSRLRYGWWNMEESPKSESRKKSPRYNIEDDSEKSRHPSHGFKPLHLPPSYHSYFTSQVCTTLHPTPKNLYEANLPLSRMHAATSMFQSLPYVSDRPPSHRYVQIETQNVVFRPIGGEIEPMFCSLAIYNVEPVSSAESLVVTTIPDFQRCGRVTEALNFDVVDDDEVAKRCCNCLWPYTRSLQHSLDAADNRLEGTRCGIFPLPSNLSFKNLYAVLVVKKVLSEPEEMEPYLKNGYSSFDIEKLKIRAQKSSRKYGQFLTPFAIGVAPLHQVFGYENPVLVVSRAVQIPLFRFLGGERRIIDHIMMMLFPRANQAINSEGPAISTNGGTATLIMRNFGFLGLHSVVDKSSLAQDRLVDFTGEFQVRARDLGNDDCEQRKSRVFYTTKLRDWHAGFVSEPAVCGGRNYVGDDTNHKSSQRLHYAQELACLPLQLTPSAGRVSSAATKPGGCLHGDDIEPFYHMSFCNELLFHPRLLHNGPKGTIVIKVEVREVEWQQDFNAFFAHVLSTGPCIHNNRRGPFLVYSAFTSCSHGEDHHYIDDFKVKLPLDLNPRSVDGSDRSISLFFTVYSVKVGSKRKWYKAKKLLGNIGVGSTDSSVQELENRNRLVQVACGFLPLTQHISLIENGAHDVRIVYTARTPPTEFCKRGITSSSTLILVEDSVSGETHHTTQLGDTFVDDGVSASDSASDVFTGSETGLGRADGSLSDLVSILEESRVGDNPSSNGDPISLSVRIIVHSSLHTQSDTLTAFLNEEIDPPRLFQLPNYAFMTKLKMRKDFLTDVDFRSAVGVHPLEQQLMELVIDITKQNLCSVHQSSSHILRIMTLLWRVLICGRGEPDLKWANPASPLPLRVHAFATIIHLIGSTSMYLSKHGVTLIDGISSFNVTTLGRVVALIFDERKLFGKQSIEVLDDDIWLTSPDSDIAHSSHSPAERRNEKRRHVRQTYDLFNDMPPRDGVDNIELVSSQAGALHAPSRLLTSSSLVTKTLGTRDLQLVQNSVADLPQETTRALKVDSKSDFQSALRAATAVADADGFEGDGGRSSRTLLQTFGGGNQSGSRCFLTAPHRLLTTIREVVDNEDMDDVDSPMIDDECKNAVLTPQETDSGFEQRDGFIVISSDKKPVKQFRVPNKGKHRSQQEDPSFKTPNVLVHPHGESLPTTDDEIESAGTAFLDVIGKTLGLNSSSAIQKGEKRSVGSQHHRKNSRGTSIDWSLLSEASSIITDSGIASKNEDGTKHREDECMSTLKTEERSSFKLPTFSDRLLLIANKSIYDTRWAPYAYEVVIMQWCAILTTQRRTVEKSIGGSTSIPTWNEIPSENEVLKHAAVRSIGVAVAGAPMLFEIIKQSLGFRIVSLFRVSASKGSKRTCPPLGILDETLLQNLEQVISMVTDACLDARNFDSWELRQLSIDVNDSIVRFLRDMFSFLFPSCVHRLVLIYLARFVTKEGKQWQDRDSGIGLRCSWEVTKMRMDAMTALVRFPDFIRVNSPQMMSWDDWMGVSPRLSPPSFFDSVLDQYHSFRLPDFLGGDDLDRKSKTDIPCMKPHWLTELVVDICLLGTVHVEQYIQQRSASILHEMFWNCAQYGRIKCRSAPIGSMFITFLEKILGNTSYLANFASKSQLRKDLLPCAVYVLEAAPGNLLRALWRKLISRLPGKGASLMGDDHRSRTDSNRLNGMRGRFDVSCDDCDIVDVFILLNLSLKTMEYEGSEETLDPDSADDGHNSLEFWRREYLLALPIDNQKDFGNESVVVAQEKHYVSSISRKWQAHDSSLVIVNTVHHVVLEMHFRLSCNPESRALLNPSVRRNRSIPIEREQDRPSHAFVCDQNISYDDVILFVRAATSVYLQSLALRQSDIVIVRTFRVTAETIKIFGIRLFLAAIGETLQHWMRVIFINCGARRALVRVEATDLLELMLRSTWECYGSFFRIRVPLLAVQTEVMERIVAIAATRYYRDQRKHGISSEKFSYLKAEASLVPLWRTLDRIETQPASQNVAFRGALIRMAGKLKKLYKAYVAARVLSFIQGPNMNNDEGVGDGDLEAETLVRSRHIDVMRVINASKGFSKQFLGFHGTGLTYSNVAHYEAVEDALIDAADVFSSTELPEHRVAWLRMLADFHRSRNKFAEEATCHFNIHTTLQLASRLHGSLWSNTPFLPWTDNIPDPVYICDWENQNAGTDFEGEYEEDSNEGNFGRQVESTNSFRRIFYRVANSVGLSNEDWDVGASKNVFGGVTYAFEYYTVSPWIQLQEMEEQMIEEAESSAELFLQAGIIQSSRFAWNLAANLYAEKFNFAKLAIAYGNLSRTVVTQVPPIDTSLPQEFSAVFGRFYRVWIHGGAPDELTGLEFVYRTEGDVRLNQFGEALRSVIQSIIPDKTPIYLLLDGRAEERMEENAPSIGFSRIGPVPLEPVRIKVTPLRPLFRASARCRGKPEWFLRYVEEAFTADHQHRTKNELNIRVNQQSGGWSQIDSTFDPNQRDHKHTYNATVQSSSSSGVLTSTRRVGSARFNQSNRVMRSDPSGMQELAGVDTFCFLQPKDRKRTSREWWKSQSVDLTEKTLKVTELQVSQAFPACVTRQEVIHRVVYCQSPFEAGLDAICQWCAILFRTAIATTGQALIGDNGDQGIGTDAAKVVADCIHSSYVKEMGLALLQQNGICTEGDNSTEFSLDYDRLTEDETKHLRILISRLLIVFVELLHLLVVRNRELLLDIIQKHKISNAPDATNVAVSGGSQNGGCNRSVQTGMHEGSRPPLSTHSQSLPYRDHDRETSTLSLRDGRTGGTLTSPLQLILPQNTNTQPGGGINGSAPPLLFESLIQRRARSVSDASLRGISSTVVAATSAPLHRPGRGSDDQSILSQSNRTASAIAVQSELQRAFVNLCKTLHPHIQGILGDETPRWLKLSGQDNYFSQGTYKLTKIPIAEEMCFNSSGGMDATSGSTNLQPEISPFLTGSFQQENTKVPSEIDSPQNESVAGSMHSVVSKGSDLHSTNIRIVGEQ